VGLEVEVPTTFYSSRYPEFDTLRDVPGNRVDGLKLAVQWSFLVSPKAKTTLALGYLNELKLVDLNEYGKNGPILANKFNPFLVAAKRWGRNFHTLLYTGPAIDGYLNGSGWKWQYMANTSVHYMLPGTRNFIGLEVNKSWSDASFKATLRPQMRLGLAENFLVGVVTGIPLTAGSERLSYFVRLIYEPSHRHPTKHYHTHHFHKQNLH